MFVVVGILSYTAAAVAVASDMHRVRVTAAVTLVLGELTTLGYLSALVGATLTA